MKKQNEKQFTNLRDKRIMFPYFKIETEERCAARPPVEMTELVRTLNKRIVKRHLDIN